MNSYFSMCRVVMISVWLGIVPGSVVAQAQGGGIGPLSLQTLDGDRMTMDNWSSRDGWVVVFLSARCPELDGPVRDLEALHEKYRFKRMLMVGICSNPNESGEELRTFCQRRGLRFPVYRDPDGTVANKFGATAVPEAFVLDSDAKILYRGTVGAPLENAVESFRRGEEISAKETEAVGTRFEELGGPREIDDPYGTIHFSSELLFEKAGDASSHHCSTVTEAPNGDLLCLWYGGTYESADDQSLFLSRRKQGQRNWSEPETLIRNSLKPPGNAVIFTDPRERVWVVWGEMESARPIRRGSGWTECRLLYRTSEDHGKSWSEDKPFPWETRRALPRNLPIELANGNFLLPLTGKGTNDVYGAMAAITSDGGESWIPSTALRGVSQPTIVQRDDGSLLALLRTQPRIERTESFDGGLTWSEPEATGLNCPGSGIAMTRLVNGNLVLVFNDSEEERTPLSVALSADEGKTWQAPFHLESNPGAYSYPCITQTGDGLIHITYTFRRYAIKHVEMNENWLTKMDRPN